jgi:formate-dependent nitrite reductase membrane component NrfD
MRNLVLLSVIIGTISIPILSATETNARRGLFRAIFIVAVFNLLYLLAIRFVYPYLN